MALQPRRAEVGTAEVGAFSEHRVKREHIAKVGAVNDVTASIGRCANMLLLQQLAGTKHAIHAAQSSTCFIVTPRPSFSLRLSPSPL